MIAYYNRMEIISNLFKLIITRTNKMIINK